MNPAVDTIILDLPSLIRAAFSALFFARSGFSLRWLRLGRFPLPRRTGLQLNNPT